MGKNCQNTLKEIYYDAWFSQVKVDMLKSVKTPASVASSDPQISFHADTLWYYLDPKVPHLSLLDTLRQEKRCTIFHPQTSNKPRVVT